jgi:hypothetical protein
LEVRGEPESFVEEKVKKRILKDMELEVDKTYHHAQKYLNFSASELGWLYLGKYFVEYEKGKISRARICEIIMNFIWKKHHGLYSKKCVL